MGFLQAMADMGKLDAQPGLESYLKLPLEKEGKVIRVYLDIEDIDGIPLQIKGVKSVDLCDSKNDPNMKRKYLYRDKVGANVGWGFTPLHKIGKPKASPDTNLKEWIGESGVWASDNKVHLYKIKNRVLIDYEREGVVQNGAVDIIMTQLEKHVPEIIAMLSNKDSHIVLFGGESDGQFVYPGDIKAFVEYFKLKLDSSLQSKQSTESLKCCALCGSYGQLTGPAKVFKFSTMDKVSFLPGLDKRRADTAFGLCRACLEKLTAGRERVERCLSSNDIIPGLRMWTIPEAVGTESDRAISHTVNLMENVRNTGELETINERRERRLFSQLARETGQGLVFHFVFWERNNAQELVHLMVEDVPPERLARLESQWEAAWIGVIGEPSKGANLDWAIRSLYAVLSRFAGKSESDKIVFRDLSLTIIGKMLRGEHIPVTVFKQAVVSRSARLIFETDKWSEIRKSFTYAQVWIEFMHRINGRLYGEH